MTGDDEGDVVVLLVGAEALDFGDDRLQQALRRLPAMALQGFDQALFAELFVVGVVGFGDAVGVEGKCIARAKLVFADFAIPIFENPEHGSGGFEALHGIVAVKQNRGEMAAVGIS